VQAHLQVDDRMVMRFMYHSLLFLADYLVIKQLIMCCVTHTMFLFVIVRQSEISILRNALNIIESLWRKALSRMLMGLVTSL